MNLTKTATAAVDTARANLATAEAAAVKAEAAYRDGLTVQSVQQLEKLAANKLSATVAVDRCNAILEAALIRLDGAQKADAAAARRARYDEAVALSDAARKRLALDYEKAARTIREILLALAKAEVAVQAANNDLPEGAPSLPDPQAARSTPGLRREVLAEDAVELWAGAGSPSQPIGAELQRKVQPIEHRRIRSRYDDEDAAVDDAPAVTGTVRLEDGILEVVKRQYRRRKVLPDVSGWRADDLLMSVNLPGDAGASPFWEARLRSASGALAELAEPLRPRPVQPKREPSFEYELVR